MTIPTSLGNREFSVIQTRNELSVFYGVKLTKGTMIDDDLDNFIELAKSGNGLHLTSYQNIFRSFFDESPELDLSNYSFEVNYDCETETRIDKQSWSLIRFPDGTPNFINCYMNTDLHDNGGTVNGQGDLEIVLWIHGKGK
jgi:hypothetical protein